MSLYHRITLLIVASPMLFISCTTNPSFRQHAIVQYQPNLTEERLSVTGVPTRADLHEMDAIYIQNYKPLERDEWSGIEMPKKFPSSNLDMTKAYTFVIYRTMEKRKSTTLVTTKLVTIRDGPQVLFDGTLCELHQCSMKRLVGRIVDGHRWKDYAQATQEKFPNNGTTFAFASYFDQVDKSNWNQSMVWQCPKCMDTEANWESQPANQKLCPP